MRPFAIPATPVAALICAVLAACSPGAPTNKAVTPAATALLEPAPGGLNPPWNRIYYFGGWGFSIKFPGSPTFSRGLEAHPTSLSAEAVIGGEEFAAASTNYDPKTRGDLEYVAKAVAAAMIDKAGGGTLVSDQPVISGKWTGRELHIDRGDQGGSVVRVFIANGRMIEVGVSTPSGLGDPTIKPFLDSLVLLDPPAPHP